MKIEYTDGYNEYGCNFGGNLGVIRYWDSVSNREFNSANKKGGLFDAVDAAKELMLSAHPDAFIILEIPDLVFSIPRKDPNSKRK